MSLLWNLDIFLCIRLQEKDLCWILPTWNLIFLIQTEQTTALLWNNCTFYFLESFRTFQWSYSSEFFWVVPSESTPANVNIFEVNGKKNTGTSQLMLFKYLHDWHGIYYSSLWRSLFLGKLQTFPISSTYNRFVEVYNRAQNTPFYKKQV